METFHNRCPQMSVCRCPQMSVYLVRPRGHHAVGILQTVLGSDLGHERIPELQWPTVGAILGGGGVTDCKRRPHDGLEGYE